MGTAAKGNRKRQEAKSSNSRELILQEAPFGHRHGEGEEASAPRVTVTPEMSPGRYDDKDKRSCQENSNPSFVNSKRQRLLEQKVAGGIFPVTLRIIYIIYIY